MAANMYRVGDYVYFENSSSNPYLIRRIEELNKTASGNVEAKVVCFYRRRDISNSLIMLADKHAKEVEEESEIPKEIDLTDKQKHQLKHRELFLSRQYESLPATHIRGKCSVALLNETESVLSYLAKEDTFFYSLVYDPSLKTLLADKGEIRVGPRYQADVPDILSEGETDDREQAKLEVKVWDPDSHLTDHQIDQFLVVARAVGTFARALDCSSSVRQPSLHMSAAAASRDITLFHAMDTLHKHNYDLSSAISVLVPLGGPVLCRDEMEEWSASEASLFEEALEKYGKDFNDIRQDFLPWKSLTSIIEYYYMWKTTDRYIQQKRLKAAEAESKLKQVYIPTYNKPNPSQISSNNGKPSAMNGAVGAPHQTQNSLIGRACESCYITQSHQWYSWGPPNMQCRLCAPCWIYWKKYGGLKMPTLTNEDRFSPNQTTEDSCVRTHMSRQATQGIPVRNTGSPKSAVKTRQSFFLHTTYLTKLARQVCRNTLQLKRAARRPFALINCAAIRAEYADRHCEFIGNPLKIKSTRKSLSCIIGYLEIHPAMKPNIIKSTPSLQSSMSKRLLAPPGHSSLSILGKRNYSHHHNGLDGLSSYAHGTKMQASQDFYTTNGKTLQVGTNDLMPSVMPLLKRQRQNWLNAPDDGLFIATEETRKRRKQFTRSQLKRACRMPCTLILRKAKALMTHKETQENLSSHSQMKTQQ
ncbi:metastasis-associated protein MTA3 [Protobothrops mucrosquamatus]|uniref:metastasis-associated protein MTA3 n=1 Tax=Protobothrops mucrosquamatus TaxID=103944 RepID=UPI0010FB45B5|nr:metastasis-associated protein MTA3 [Protobothrops mucrosquamatus]